MPTRLPRTGLPSQAESSRSVSILNDFPLSNKFTLNTLITRFGEFRLFTGVTSLQFWRDGGTSFGYCSNLEYIDLSNITYIYGSSGGSGSGGNTASPLRGTSLEEITLPNLTRVNSYAFHNGTSASAQGSLRRINIGDSFTTISNAYAFSYLNGASIKLLTVTPATGSTLRTDTRGSAYIYVPDESVDTYKDAAAWANWKNYIKPLSECPW